MKDLIERLEKATEPDRYLDLAILNALRADGEWVFHDRHKMHVICNKYGNDAPGNPICSLERFTGSLDDARALVPEGFYWLVSEGRTRASEPLGGAQVFKPSYLVEPLSQAEHESAVIALCIAALKARAMSAGQRNE